MTGKVGMPGHDVEERRGLDVSVADFGDYRGIQFQKTSKIVLAAEIRFRRGEGFSRRRAEKL